jgi:hypothetical protein
LNLTQNRQLACTASGLSFEEWRRRPVYLAHCKTFSVAQALCGIQLLPGQGRATALNGDSMGLSSFRALRPYRTPEGISLRNAVAREIRSQRRGRTLHA